jgi:hypothetical protein
MSFLTDLIVTKENLELIQEALETMSADDTLDKEKSERITALLDIIKKPIHFFSGKGVISAFTIYGPNKLHVPELFHLPCVEYLENGNFADKKFPIVLPGRGRLTHSGNPNTGNLFLLECETCKKVFKISVVE